MNNNMDNFKRFIKNNTFLISYVRNGKKSWQDLYEMFDLFGEDEEAWNEYLKDNNDNNINNNNKNYWNDFVKFAKNIDVSKVQEGITSLQKTLSLFSDLFVNKETSSNTYNPRPLYRKFED